MQDRERHLCRDRLQKGDVILEFDYAAKMTCFQQDAMSCSAARQTSNFVVFAHFNPKHDDTGKNIDDTTEVFKFHSDCTKQDTHSIRRALIHVLQNLIECGHLSKHGTAHLWADGCGSQNKGRKSFRQWSELSVELGHLSYCCKFPCILLRSGRYFLRFQDMLCFVDLISFVLALPLRFSSGPGGVYCFGGGLWFPFRG